MITLQNAVKNRILVIDGAMGSLIQGYKLAEKDFRGDILQNHHIDLKGNNDILCLTRPDIIEEIHRKYLAAGADIIETNTFNGTAISQADYETEHLAYDINFQAAKIARRAADDFTAQNPEKPRFVAGGLGPTNVTASLSPDVNRPAYRAVHFDQLRDACKYYILDIACEEGESHATRFIREFNKLYIRDGEVGTIELPSYYTKRRMYRTYC